MKSFIKVVFLFLVFPLMSFCEATVELLQMPDREIEIYFQKPDNEEFSLLLFLHGAAADNGIKSLSHESLEHWLNKGYGIAAVSMPGYGQSSGGKDFCGPFTIDTLHQAVNVIKKKMNVSEFGIIGYGQGSMAGAPSCF